MKKSILYLTLLAILTSCTNSMIDEPTTRETAVEATSTQIPLETAIKTAERYVTSLKDHPTRTSSLEVGKIEYITPSKATRACDQNPSYYIINFEDNEGFAIVPADTRLPQEAYAFSNESSLSLQDTILNKSLSLFLNSLPSPDNYSNTTRAIGDEDAKPVTTKLEKIVSPILSYEVTNWHQGAPYNKYCPVKNDTICAVGCPAMAVGMILSAFQYPKSYNGYSFPWFVINFGSNKDYTARMLQVIGSKSLLDQFYGIKVSGILFLETNKIEDTFTKLGYDYRTTVINEEDMNSSLSQNSPVLVVGCNRASNYGHVWAIDGYAHASETYSTYTKDLGNYYHCVWGWGGKSNGYFRCLNLGTNNAGIGGDTPFADSGGKIINGPVFDQGVSLGVIIYHNFSIAK